MKFKLLDIINYTMDCGLFGVRFLFLGMKKERCSMDELFIYFATPPFEDFLASAGRVAVTEGGDLGGLGVIPQQAFWPVRSGQNRKTCICLHCLPVVIRNILLAFLLELW